MDRFAQSRSSAKAAARRPARLVLIASAALVGLAGCEDAYRRQADADVYRLLHDRKAQALGYDPQAVSEPVIRPAPGAAGLVGQTPATRPTEDANRAARDAAAGADPRKSAVENDPASPAPLRAYATIPVTPIPPSAPPAIELPKEPDTTRPLGPYPGEAPVAKTRFDPFAAEMAARWTENRYVYGPNPPRREPVRLDLFSALRYGVDHSRSYRTQMDQMYLQALDVTLERHLLSPRPFAKAGLQYTGGQQASAYNSALTATMDAGVRQKLPYGGEIVAESLVSFVRAIDGNVTDGETASVALSGSIPLLRGAGLVNLEGLISSEREVIYQVRAFEEFRRQYAIDVANAYFQLLASFQAVNNRRENVVNSVSLLDRTRAIYAANARTVRLTFLEVQRAEQQLLDSQNSLIQSQRGYLNSLDNFRILLGMDMREEVDIIPVALDVTTPELEDQDAIELANRYRLDLQTARDRIDDSRRGVEIARNSLLPDLSLTGGATLGNPTDAPAKSLNSRNLTYNAGVTLDLPVDRLAERNAYRRSLIGFYAAQRSYDDLQDRVSADVRAAVRAIRASEVSVAIQKRSIELAERRLENANLLLKRGDINARDVVEAQTSLIGSQDQYEQARADLQVQVLQFLKQTGTLRIDPGTGTLGRAMDRSGKPYRPAAKELPALRASSGTIPEPAPTSTDLSNPPVTPANAPGRPG